MLCVKSGWVASWYHSIVCPEFFAPPYILRLYVYYCPHCRNLGGSLNGLIPSVDHRLSGTLFLSPFLSKSKFFFNKKNDEVVLSNNNTDFSLSPLLYLDEIFSRAT